MPIGRILVISGIIGAILVGVLILVLSVANSINFDAGLAECREDWTIGGDGYNVCVRRFSLEHQVFNQLVMTIGIGFIVGCLSISTVGILLNRYKPQRMGNLEGIRNEQIMLTHGSAEHHESKTTSVVVKTVNQSNADHSPTDELSIEKAQEEWKELFGLRANRALTKEERKRLRRAIVTLRQK